MEQPLDAPRMPPKKKVDFATEQFLRAVKHWTDQFISGEIRVGIFINSIQDESQLFCKQKNREDEWEEFLRDFIDDDDDHMSQSSGEVIDVDE